MEEIVPHCQTCKCFTEKPTNQDPLGDKILGIARYGRRTNEFRSLVLKFIANNGLNLTSIHKDIGLGRQAFENFIYDRSRPQFKTIAKIYRYLRESGLEL